MPDWLREIVRARKADNTVCLVTVVEVRGSAPRESGTRMLVDRDRAYGTIGGGQLEHQCAELATQMLDDSKPRSVLRRFPLGSQCGQCCGGVVKVLFDRIDAADDAWIDELHHRLGRGETVTLSQARDGERKIDMRLAPVWHSKSGTFCDRIGPAEQTVAIFGAGHVGSALVAVLAPLDCSIRWVDSRPGFIPDVLPANVTAVLSDNPAAEASLLPAGADCFVMTHSHALDLDVCAVLLARDDLGICGLIGSAAKRRRFEKRLTACGLNPQQIDALQCPIGAPGVGGKRPQAIAIAVSAQLLGRWTQQAQTSVMTVV